MFRRTKLCSSILVAFGGTLGFVGLPAFGQQLERVEITGSSIKRIDSETALPVTVITREEIARSGAVTMEQLVQNVAAASTAGAVKGSDLAGQASYGLSSVSLRGLEDKRTLVLVNGRRLAPFASDGAAVNINAIPLSAIERVEVLRDGASAVYGSDAVAGVINFILRRDYNGVELTAEAGQPTQSGGGKTVRGNIVFGKGDLATDKYNFMVGFDVEKSTTLYASERGFSSSGNRSPYFQNAATPSGRIEGVWVPGQNATQNGRQGDPSKPAYNPLGYSSSGYGNPSAPDNCSDISMFPVDGTGGVGGKFNNCNFDSAPFVGLFPRTVRANLYGTFRVEVAPEATIYGEGMFARNRITEAYQPAPARAGFFSTDNFFNGSGVDAALLIRPGNPYYNSVLVPYLNSHSFVDLITDPANPAGPKISVTRPLSDMVGQTIAVTYRAFGAGLRTEEDTLSQSRVLLGVQGTVGTWDYDVAAMFNESKTEGSLTEGYFSQVGLANVLNSSDWNPWAAGGEQTPAITSQLKATNYVGPTLTGRSAQYSVDGKASTSLMELPGGPLQVATGASVRKEKYLITVPDILGTGDIAGLGGATSPEDASRTVVALFGEFNMPVLKELELNTSVRLDRYSDVGSTTNGKVSARWQPAKEILLRSAIGTGFRAPTLSELHQPQTAGTTEQFIDPLFPGDGNVQPNAIIGGNPDLKPEKSKQFSLGLVFSPTKTFTMSADYFVIKVNNFIIKPSALGLVNAVRAGTPVFGPGDVIFAPDGVTVDTVNQIYRNSASALVKGTDLGATWTNKLETGQLTFDLNGTYMQTYNLKNITNQGSVGTIVQSDGTSPLDIASTGVVARWKHTLSANWTSGAWSTTLAQNYYAGYRDRNLTDDVTPHYIPATATYDVQFVFNAAKMLKLTVGVKNLFDKDPPLFIGNGSSFQYGYDPTMSDPRGRFMYAGMTLKF